MQEEFDSLDCLATKARSEKTKLPGGFWKLHTIYRGLDRPPGHLTESDWQNYLSHLQRWVDLRKSSVTARVALAAAYTSYAWDARGEGYSDSVTENGWNLFNQRLAKARSILAEAWELSPRCPEWFVVLQVVAQGQQWGSDDELALFQQAVGFEPDYYYYYRMHATFLLPQWNGEQGDAAKFAEESANRVGGKQGDILYFQIASNLVCNCEEPEVLRMSWQRIQNGFAELEKASGPSLVNLNPYALMATKFNDPVAANAALQRIGENWNSEVWGSEKYFGQAKEWATKIGPLEERSRGFMREAESNEQTPGGSAYKSKVELRFSRVVQNCLQDPNADIQKFVFVLKIAQDGSPVTGWFPVTTGMSNCVWKQMVTAQIKKQAIFPQPPTDAYWVKLEIDPAAVKVAAR